MLELVLGVAIMVLVGLCGDGGGSCSGNGRRGSRGVVIIGVRWMVVGGSVDGRSSAGS